MGAAHHQSGEIRTARKANFRDALLCSTMQSAVKMNWDRRRAPPQLCLAVSKFRLGIDMFRRVRRVVARGASIARLTSWPFTLPEVLAFVQAHQANECVAIMGQMRPIFGQ